jgi:hypothetical protein
MKKGKYEKKQQEEKNSINKWWQENLTQNEKLSREHKNPA